jgi:hypothetical protein
MEDVLGLYERPLSVREPVVCIDEKPVVLHEDTRTPIPMLPGRVARRDYEYKRCGTANVFCGVEPKAGRHFTKVTATRCSAEFADYLLKIAVRYPRSRHHPPGHGQPLHAYAEGAGGTVRRHRRDLVVGPIHDPLHPQTWKLAESGGDGGQHVQPPVPRQTTDRRYRRLAKTGSRMEPPRQ